MIAVTLQKLPKSSFPSSVFSKYRGILNDIRYITKWLETYLPFSVLEKLCDSLPKNVVCFQTQGALFPNFFSFKTQRCKVHVEFETKQIWKRVHPQFGTKKNSFESSSQRKCAWISNFASLSFKLQATHVFDSTNIDEVQTPFSLFCRYVPSYLPKLKSFNFVSRIGPSPFVRSILIPRLTPYFFNLPRNVLSLNSQVDSMDFMSSSISTISQASIFSRFSFPCKLPSNIHQKIYHPQLPTSMGYINY